jgi:hypothetical protein
MREKVARAERVRADRVAAALARKADAKNAKQRNEETRLRLQLEGAERLSAERETAARAYEHYLRVRDWAAESSDSGGAVILSPSEQRMREGLRHLWDAAPETIARLRHSCAPLSGDRAADYDPPSIELKQRVRHGINAMRRWAGKDLLVAEPAALGGFGCAVGGERYNTDTVRFFNSLVALRDAAVLGGFEHAPSRQLVWEIGGGWGGFAYQFKRLFPNVTYVISGIPELLLVSSVYLLTLFPDAQIRLHRSRAGDEVWQDWESADFVLAGEHELLGLSPPRLDLTLDVMALARMTPPRRATHVRAAFECGSRYFYSSSAADAGEEASAAVRQAIEPWYWPHPVPPRVDAAAEDEGGYGAALGALEYAHLVGWRRIHA